MNTYKIELEVVAGKPYMYDITGEYRNDLVYGRYFEIHDVKREGRILGSGVTMNEGLKKEIQSRVPKITQPLEYRSNFLEDDFFAEISDKVIATKDYHYPIDKHKQFLKFMEETKILTPETVENFMYGIEKGYESDTSIKGYFVLTAEQQQEMGVTVPYTSPTIQAVQLMSKAIGNYEKLYKKGDREISSLQVIGEKSYQDGEKAKLEQEIKYEGNTYIVEWDSPKINKIEISGLKFKEKSTYVTVTEQTKEGSRSTLIKRKRLEKKLLEYLPRAVYRKLYEIIKKRVE